jgi:hypothetical protein
MLAFEAELAHLPRSLIEALWELIDGAGLYSSKSLPLTLTE